MSKEKFAVDTLEMLMTNWNVFVDGVLFSATADKECHQHTNTVIKRLFPQNGKMGLQKIFLKILKFPPMHMLMYSKMYSTRLISLLDRKV